MPAGEQEVDAPGDADGPVLWQAVLLAGIGFIATPLVYPLLLGAAGLAPSDAGVPPTFAIQLVAATYPLVRYAVASHTSTGEDGPRSAATPPVEAMTSLPDDAIGRIDPEDIYDDAVDGELHAKHEGESPAALPDAWCVTDIRRAAMSVAKTAKCAETGEEFRLDGPHYVVAVTYDPPGIDRSSTVYFRFRDRDAAKAWLSDG